MTFGSDRVRTLLALVLRNASTDSPWPLCNNPYAKYNDVSRRDSNLKFPLWQLVRASTAAPTFFPPEVIVIPHADPAKEKEFIFVDGGVTMYNNPAFQMFLMATLDRYWPRNPTRAGAPGPTRCSSSRSGPAPAPTCSAGLQASDMNLLFNATTIPAALMFAALNEQDLLCRVFGDCLAGDPIDRELGDLIGSAGPLAAQQKLFTYVRYNAELSRAGLDALDCPDIEPEAVQKLDAVDSIGDLRKVGRHAAAAHVKAEHFAGFPPA